MVGSYTYTLLTAYGKSIEDLEDLEKKLECVYKKNKLSVNVAKTESMFLGSRQRLPKLPLEPMMYVLGVIPSKKSEIPKYLECILTNLLRGAVILKK